MKEKAEVIKPPKMPNSKISDLHVHKKDSRHSHKDKATPHNTIQTLSHFFPKRAALRWDLNPRHNAHYRHAALPQS